MDYMQEINQLRKSNDIMAQANDKFLDSIRPMQRFAADVYEAGVGCHADFKSALTSASHALDVVAKMIAGASSGSVVDQLNIVNAISDCNSHHQELNTAFMQMVARLQAVVERRAGTFVAH